MISSSKQLRPRFFFVSLFFILIFILSGCNNDSDTSSTPQDGNQQPTAKITASLASAAGKTVTLDGSSSSDPDGDTLSFRWEQIEGPDVTLSGVSTATLSFSVPTVLQPTQFTFQLTVDDGDLSSTTTMSFQISPSDMDSEHPNQQPYAMVTAPETATSGQTVTLNGSGSSDPDGDNLTYKWTQTKGSNITLSNSSSSTLTFVAPTVSQATQFTFQLTVEDGVLSSTTSVNIQVTPRKTTNQQPNAKITAPQAASSGQTVTLNGGGSSDPDGDPISYKWTQTEGPEIAFSNSLNSNLIFVAPEVTQATKFTFQLTVHDGELSNSASVSMQISPMGGNTSPSIVSRSPQPDQSGVSTSAEISARFDKALLESSVDSRSLQVSQNSSPVSGTFSYDSSNYTLTFKPTSDLSAGVIYTVTLAGTIKDLSGNDFAGASWSFSTAAGTVVTDGTCATAEENNSLTLSCPSGEVITEVKFASYGTPGGMCDSFTTGSCNASSSMTVVSDTCKGKNSCALYAGNDTFGGDPCQETAKKLVAQVVCGVETNQSPNPTPVPGSDDDSGLKWVDEPIGMAVVNQYGVESTTGGGDGEVVIARSKSELADYAGRSEPLYIIVEGTLKGSGAITIKSNKTIIGAGSGATLDGIELNTNKDSNIIIRNLTIKNVGRDAICTREAHHVWIDHVDLSNCGDGLLDIVAMSDLITVSWSRFSDHHKTMLINSGTSKPEDDPYMNTTLHHNWWDGSNTRNPRAAYGDIHVFNCMYNDNSYGIGLHSHCMVLSEKNYFDHVKDPIHQMYRDDPNSIHHGFCSDVGSIFDNVSGDKDIEDITVNFREDYYMYDFAVDPAEDVPTIVKEHAGPGQEWSELGPLPVPGLGAINVSTSPTLRWTRGHSAASYKVSFGTTNPPPSVSATSEQTFSPGSLNSGTVYYWRVDQVKSDGGMITGNVWRFRTK